MDAPTWRTGRRLVSLVALATLSSSCGHCGRGAELREGSHPYRACLLGDAPDAREVELGTGRLSVEGRSARYTRVGGDHRLRVAAFRGADDEVSELPRAASAIDEEGVDLVVVLGGLGREPRQAAAHLEALSLTRRPVVLLPGGDDSLAALDEALDDLPSEARARFIDGRRVHVLDAGERRWLLLPGAPAGRYAYSERACGYAPGDVDERRDALGGEPALTLGWAVPSAALDVPREGIFAFPPEGDSAHAPGRAVVGPLAGPPHLSSGAYRKTGPTLLRLGPEGLEELGTIAFRRDARVVRPPSP